MRKNMTLHLVCLMLLCLPVTFTLRQGMCAYEQEILPCTCKMRINSILLSCRHATASELKFILGVVAHRTPIIEELLLEDNFLPELSADIFESSPQVHRLFIWNNGIRRIVNGTLDHIGNDLRDLHLREPQLTDVPKDMLVSMVHLRKLTIENTPLNILPEVNFCESLVEVYIDDTRISHVGSHAFLDLQELRLVELTNSWVNHFSHESLHNLPSLVTLNLTGNYISILNASGWKYLPNLKTVDLRENAIRETTSWINYFESLKLLESLHLDKNRIRTLDIRLLTQLPNLKELTLSRNYIEEVVNGNYANERFSNLEKLDLNYNKLKHVPQKLVHLTPALKVLRLHGNPLNDSPLNLEAILDSTQVMLLEFDNCEVEEISLRKAENRYSLEEISLRGNLLQSLPLNILAKLITLKELDLSRNNFSRITDDLTKLSKVILVEKNNNHPWIFPALRTINLSESWIKTFPLQIFDLFPYVRSLYLQQNNLTELPPIGWESAKNLAYLDLSRNHLEGINRDFCKGFGLLETLRLSENSLSAEINLEDCRNLRALDLSVNNIREMPSSAFRAFATLQTLNMSFNLLSTMPDVRELRQLTTLSIAWNNIRKLKATDFISNINLETIDFSHNLIEEVPPGYFKSAKRLEKVDFSHNQLVFLSANTFNAPSSPYGLDLSFNRIEKIEAGFFSTLRRLRNLNLSHNNLTAMDFKEIAALDKVRVINVSSNRIEDIRGFSAEDMPTVVELDFSDNRVSSIHGSQFSNSRALMRIDLSGNEIQFLPRDAFASLPNLEELSLAKNRLQRIGHSTFNDLLSLEYLRLDDNSIESIHQDAFTGFFAVRALNLSSNNITMLENAGINNLYSLEILDASSNKIEELNGKSLKRLERLLYLNLDKNNITYVGEASLKHQSHLVKISLRGNKLESLPEKFLVPDNLRQLDLKENPLMCDCGLIKMLEKLRKARSRSLERNLILRKTRIPALDSEDTSDPNIIGYCPALPSNASRLFCKGSDSAINEEHTILPSSQSEPFIVENYPPLDLSQEGIMQPHDVRSNVSTIYAKIQKNCSQTDNSSHSGEESSSSRLRQNLLPVLLTTGAWISRLWNRSPPASQTPVFLPINQIGSELLQTQLYPGLTSGQLLAIANNHFNLSLLANTTNNGNTSKTNDESNHLSSTSRPAGKMHFPQYSPPAKTVKLLDYGYNRSQAISDGSGDTPAPQQIYEWSPLVACGNFCGEIFHAPQPGYAQKHDSAGINVTDPAKENKREILSVTSGIVKEALPPTGYALPMKDTKVETFSLQTINYDSMTKMPERSESANANLSQIFFEVSENSPSFLEASMLVVNDLSNNYTFTDQILGSESTGMKNTTSSTSYSVMDFQSEKQEASVDEYPYDDDFHTGPSIPEFVYTHNIYHAANDRIIQLNQEASRAHELDRDESTLWIKKNHKKILSANQKFDHVNSLSASGIRRYATGTGYKSVFSLLIAITLFCYAV